MLAHRSKVWWLEVEMLGVIPEEGAWGAAVYGVAELDTTEAT